MYRGAAALRPQIRSPRARRTHSRYAIASSPAGLPYSYRLAKRVSSTEEQSGGRAHERGLRGN